MKPPRHHGKSKSGKPDRQGDKPRQGERDKPRADRPRQGERDKPRVDRDRPRPSDRDRQRSPERERQRQPERDKDVSPFTPRQFFVDGFAAVAEYVRFRPSSLVEIRAQKSERTRVEELLKQHDVRVPVLERKPGEAPDEKDAPVSARVSLKALEPDAFYSRISDRTTDLILALDHVQDPRNLGAIVRSAAFFGVREVLAPERRQVLLTQSSVATAQGGFAITDLVCVVNLARTLRELKDQGYWIIGTAMDGEPLQKLVGAYEKVVLVLGSEESGLSKGIREHVDRLGAISSKGPGLESLNVSVAAGIFLNALAR